jgi:membrane protease subunit (stomatin/prohibitin family)
MIKSINSAVERVKSSYPSIYSKDDVVNLLIELMSDLDTEINEMIEADRAQHPTNGMDLDKLQDALIDAIETKLDRLDGSDAVDYDSACFEMYSNTVSLESADVNVSGIMDAVEKGIKVAIQEMNIVMEDETAEA